METKDIILCKLEFCASYIYDEHNHLHYELNYIQSGRCMMVVEDRNVALRTGDCIFLPPNVRHNFMVHGKSKCQLIQLSFKLQQSAPASLSLNYFTIEQPFFKLVHCTDVLESLKQLYTYRQAKEYPTYQIQLFNLELEKLFVFIGLHMEQARQIEYKYETHVLNTIVSDLDKYYDQDIQIETLAQNHKISSRYLRSLFVKHIGFSAIEYITLLRMEKAKDLLKNTKLSISEVGIRVGYNTVQYFTKVFTRKVGLTPKVFRNQYRI